MYKHICCVVRNTLQIILLHIDQTYPNLGYRNGDLYKNMLLTLVKYKGVRPLNLKSTVYCAKNFMNDQ